MVGELGGGGGGVLGITNLSFRYIKFEKKKISQDRDISI